MNSTALTAARDAGSRARAARFLAQLASIALVAMPLAMWAANRSATLVIGLAAAATLGAALAAGDGRQLGQRLALALRTPVGLAMAGFLLWALVTLGWSHRPAQGFAMWAELALPVASGVAIGLAARFRATSGVVRAFAVALVAAAGLVMVELHTGLAARTLLGVGKQQGFIFNRPVIACLVLAAPALHLLWRRPAVSGLDRVLGVLVILSVSAAVLAAESGAAKLGLAVLVGGWLFTRLLPRLALGLAALAFAAALLLAPVIGRLADAALPPALHETLADSHSRDRVDIWLSFGEAIRARPLQGSGFGASAALRTHPVAAEVSAPRRVLLDVGHPHSAPVQVWTETGAIGALLLLVAGLGCLWWLRGLGPHELAPRLAVFASAFCIACVGHGAWQGWWIAILAAALVWFAAPPAQESAHA